HPRPPRRHARAALGGRHPRSLCRHDRVEAQGDLHLQGAGERGLPAGAIRARQCPRGAGDRRGNAGRDRRRHRCRDDCVPPPRGRGGPQQEVFTHPGRGEKLVPQGSVALRAGGPSFDILSEAEPKWRGRRSKGPIPLSNILRAARPHPRASTPASTPTDAAIFSSLARFSGFIPHSGGREFSSMRPIMASTAFTGMGFDSMKLPSISGRYLRCKRRAVSHLLASAARVSAPISAGISLDATEITPVPPREITGSVMASSPEKTRKSPGTALNTSAIWLMLPLASFTATIFGISASRASVPGSRFAPVRPGTLYSTSGLSTASAMARKCRYCPSCVGLL